MGESLGNYAKGLTVAAIAFALYGLVGQFVVAPGPLFPSTVVNSDWFLSTFRFPVQLFRAAMAVLVAVFTISALRAFDVNRRRQTALFQEQAREAVERRDALRGELLPSWIQSRPGTRPRGWWLFDAPGRRERIDNEVHPHDKPGADPQRRLFMGKPARVGTEDRTAVYETQESFLRRHSLLSDAEQLALDGVCER